MEVKSKHIKKFFVLKNADEANAYNINIRSYKLTDHVIIIRFSRDLRKGSIYKAIDGEFSSTTHAYVFWDWFREELKRERSSKLKKLLK